MKQLLLRSLALVPLISTLAVPAQAGGNGDPAPATVTVIHGIPGQDLGLDPSLAVDVSVDGQCVLAGFEFRDIAGPLSLPPATYRIEISVANPDDPCSNDAVISADVPFVAGENATVIAHLDASGAPTASKFVNDASPIGFLRTRVELRHTAAAPAVDLSLQRVFSFFFGNAGIQLDDVTNGVGAGADVLFGLYRFQAAVSATGDVALGPLYGFLLPWRTYRVYVVGSATTGSLSLIVQAG